MLATALVASLVVFVDLKLWRMSAHVPLFGADGDDAFFLAAVKDVVEHGWFVSNPDLGAPFGQSNYDFAALFGDLAHFGIVKLLAIAFGDPVVVFNAFFLLGFPLVAVVAYGVLRDLGAPPAVALVAGVLFAFLPYHMLRNQQHLFLSAYYAVPLAVWLVVALAEGRTLIERRLSRRTLTTVGVCLVVSAASAYYAVFALIALLVVVPVAALAWRSRAMALQCAVVVGVVFAGFVACHSPPIVHALVDGRNDAVARRSPVESELLGLKLTHMVIPRPGHRLGFMSRRGERYAKATPTTAEGFSPALGSVATIGLAGAILVLLATGLGSRQATLRRRRIAAAGATALGCFVVGTVGGGSALIAFELSPQVRAWNRLSILIAFAALLTVALALTALSQRWRARGRSRWPFAAVLVAIGVAGLLDQTSPRDAPDYRAIAASWRDAGDFVRVMETRLPARTNVLQLPWMSYPENGPLNAMRDYDHLKGYLHSTRLRWSYGAMKGRPTDWHDNAQVLGGSNLATAAMIAGFGAIEVDRRGYAYDGADVIGSLSKLVGADHTASSASGRLQFFDLRDAAARVTAKTTPPDRRDISDALLYPVTVNYGAGFSYQDYESAVPFRWAAADATLRLDNTLDKPRRVRFTAALFGGGSEPSTVTVTFPGGLQQTVAATSAGTEYGADLVVPPGGGVVRIRTRGPAAPLIAGNVFDRRLRIKDPRVREHAIADARLTRLAQIASAPP